MVYVNNNFSRSRKLSVVSWLPDFDMADVKPEVHLNTELEGLSGEVQRLPAHFRQRLSTGDYADIVQHYNDNCLTAADSRKPKWRPITGSSLYLWTGLRYQRNYGGYTDIFDHARFTSHTAITVRRRPANRKPKCLPVNHKRSDH